MRTLFTILVGASVVAAGDPKAALMDADRAFARTTAEKGLDGWMGFMADDAAKTRRPGDKLTVGKAAIRAEDAAIFADPAKKLVWEPVDAHPFADGKSGVTSGRYKMIATDKDGKETVLSTGGYVTVWRQDKDGSWKVVFDTGSPDPPAKK
jgi:ketosteroid isomerase-like protein